MKVISQKILRFYFVTITVYILLKNKVQQFLNIVILK